MAKRDKFVEEYINRNATGDVPNKFYKLKKKILNKTATLSDIAVFKALKLNLEEDNMPKDAMNFIMDSRAKYKMAFYEEPEDDF